MSSTFFERRHKIPKFFTLLQNKIKFQNVQLSILRSISMTESIYKVWKSQMRVEKIKPTIIRSLFSPYPFYALAMVLHQTYGRECGQTLRPNRRTRSTLTLTMSNEESSWLGILFISLRTKLQFFFVDMILFHLVVEKFSIKVSRLYVRPPGPTVV